MASLDPVPQRCAGQHCLSSVRLATCYKEQYVAAVQVEAVRATRLRQPSFLRLKQSHGYIKPTDTDLVYLERSPNYCEEDASTTPPRWLQSHVLRPRS